MTERKVEISKSIHTEENNILIFVDGKLEKVYIGDNLIVTPVSIANKSGYRVSYDKTILEFVENDIKVLENLKKEIIEESKQ